MHQPVRLHEKENKHNNMFLIIYQTEEKETSMRGVYCYIVVDYDYAASGPSYCKGIRTWIFLNEMREQYAHQCC